MKELIIYLSIVFVVFLIVLKVIYRSYKDLQNKRFNFKLPKTIGIDNGKTVGVYCPVIDRTTYPPSGVKEHKNYLIQKELEEFMKDLFKKGLLRHMSKSIYEHVIGYLIESEAKKLANDTETLSKISGIPESIINLPRDAKFEPFPNYDEVEKHNEFNLIVDGLKIKHKQNISTIDAISYGNPVKDSLKAENVQIVALIEYLK